MRVGLGIVGLQQNQEQIIIIRHPVIDTVGSYHPANVKFTSNYITNSPLCCYLCMYIFHLCRFHTPVGILPVK